MTPRVPFLADFGTLTWLFVSVCASIFLVENDYPLNNQIYSAASYTYTVPKVCCFMLTLLFFSKVVSVSLSLGSTKVTEQHITHIKTCLMYRTCMHFFGG